MRFGVLGPLAVWTDDGAPVRVPGRLGRVLLADLLVHEGRPASVDRLVDDLWGAQAPADPTAALQVRVSQLRRALDDAEPGARDLVVSSGAGYALHTGAGAVDAVRFADLAARARDTDDPRSRERLCAEALSVWRGPAYADFPDGGFARTAAAGLEEQRLVVLEERAEAKLELGAHGALAAELHDLVVRHPLRERLRAAHIRALYGAGRQSEALDSFDDLRRRLVDELGVDPSPELAALHQAVLRQDPSLAGRAPVPASPGGRTTNLPTPLTDLVGRDQAVAALSSLLGDERSVTLTGPGGVGKTRLAVEVARAHGRGAADGPWLIELAALAPRDDAAAGDDLAELVLDALEVRATPGAAPRALDRLTAALAHRSLLLVLDNCEHVAGQAADLAAAVLQAAPDVRILATSRRPLDLSGEVVWEVPALAVPADPAQDPAALLDWAAVRLFVARATAATRGFALDVDNGPAVAQLCRRLDGIPLALELAATRVRGLGVDGVVGRLDDRFRLLTVGHRGAPARQRTLAAVIDWSWELLTDPERRVLRRLAVHVDGCTLDAAEALCVGDGVAAADVPGLLAALVDHSLVVLDDRPGHGPRYRLLESVAAYCTDRLREAGELDDARDRHAAHHVDVAERADPQVRGHDQRRWLRRLDADGADLRSASEHLVARGRADDALRLATALTWYRVLRGRHDEARRSLAAALAVPGEASPAARAAAEVWSVGIAALRGTTDGWVDAARAALRRLDDAGAPAVAARARWFVAHVMVELGELTSGEDLVLHASAAFEELGDRWGEAASLTVTAKLAHIRRDLAVLAHDAGRSAELFAAVGDQWGVLQATHWLVGAADLAGDHERALRLCRDGVALAEQLGLWPDAAGLLAWRGWIAVQIGDYADAREWSGRALALASEQGFDTAVSTAKIGLGFAARRDGKLDVAEDVLRELESTARRSRSADGELLYLSMVLIELGHLAAQRGDVSSALGLHLEAFDIALAQDAPADTASAFEGMAGALVARGRHDDAARLLGAAGRIRGGVGLPSSPSEQEIVMGIAAVLRAALGDEPFAAAVAQGGELTPEEARRLVGLGPEAHHDVPGPG